MKPRIWCLGIVLATIGFLAAYATNRTNSVVDSGMDKANTAEVDGHKVTQGGESVVAKTNPKKKTDIEIVCRRIRPTGSRLWKKVCKTRRQCRIEHEDTQRFFEKPRSGPTRGQ